MQTSGSVYEGMPARGLEPPRPKGTGPQPAVYTSSTTRATYSAIIVPIRAIVNLTHHAAVLLESRASAPQNAVGNWRWRPPVGPRCSLALMRRWTHRSLDMTKVARPMRQSWMVDDAHLRKMGSFDKKGVSIVHVSGAWDGGWFAACCRGR
jgi:hypothetical protein